MGFRSLQASRRVRWLGFYCFRSSSEDIHFLVPRSLSLISFTPRLAAFNTACLGDFPVKTHSRCLRISEGKFLAAISVIVAPQNILKRCALRRLLALYTLLIFKRFWASRGFRCLPQSSIVILSAISVIRPDSRQPLTVRIGRDWTSPAFQHF